MEFVVISLLNGITYGLLLFMLSSGLTLIFSMMGILNFAHASFYMLGAYFAYQISTLVGFWPGLLVAPLLVGAVGALVERYGLRRAHKFGHVAELLFTFGLAFVVEEVVHLIWGKVAVDAQALLQVGHHLGVGVAGPAAGRHALGGVAAYHVEEDEEEGGAAPQHEHELEQATQDEGAQGGLGGSEVSAGSAV